MISENPHYLSGRKKFEAKDYAGALEDYSKAIEKEENPSIYSERAVVLYYLKRKEDSLKDMNYAAQLEPENPYRYSSRAYIKDSMGDIEGAIEDYERAIALDPEDAIAHNNLGMLQEKLGYASKAKKHFNHADTLAEVDQLLADVRAKQGIEEDFKEEESAPTQSESREALSIMALLRNTLTTKDGFSEYIKFIKDGFRLRK